MQKLPLFLETEVPAPKPATKKVSVRDVQTEPIEQTEHWPASEVETASDQTYTEQTVSQQELAAHKPARPHPDPPTHDMQRRIEMWASPPPGLPVTAPSNENPGEAANENADPLPHKLTPPT